MPLLNAANTLFLKETEFIVNDFSLPKSVYDFNQHNYWYCDFYNDISLKHLLNPSVVPTHIWDLIRNKNCFLILSNTFESFLSVVTTIYQLLVLNLKIPPDQIILISGSATINKEVEKIAQKFNCGKIKTEWIRFFEISLRAPKYKQKELKTLQNKKYQKKFLSLNRTWRIHRPLLIGHLYINNLLDDGFVSFVKNVQGRTWSNFYDEINYTLDKDNKLLTDINLYRENISNIPDMYLDQTDMNLNHTPAVTSTDYYYENSYFSVVTETNFFEKMGESIFLSEKTFKPIFKKHPFILLARPFSLHYLKRIGYKTFDNIICEDYDTETDDYKRFTMIIEEIKRLCNLNTDELGLFLEEAKKIVDYNYNVLTHKTEFITKLY